MCILHSWKAAKCGRFPHLESANNFVGTVKVFIGAVQVRQLNAVWRAIKRWYRGDFIMFEKDSRFGETFKASAHWKRHWTARIARAPVDFYRCHWQWLWSTLVLLVPAFINLV